MSIIQFLRILLARWPIIVGTTISCVVGAYLVTLLLPPRWQAHSRVMMELIKPDPVTGLVIGTMNTRAYVATQKELITDYSVAGPVVDRLGMTTDPALIEAYEKRPKGDVRDFRRWAAQLIMDRTQVEALQGSNILEITYSGPSPTQAKAVADTLREAYIDATLATRRQQADRSAGWFAIQADKIKVELDAAEKAAGDYERTNGIVLQDDKSDVESARLRALATQTGGAPVLATGQLGSSPASMELAQVDAQIAQLSKTLGPNHPELQNLRARRGVLAGAVAQDRAAADAAMASAAGAGAQAADRAMVEQKARVMAQRDKVARALQLQSEVNVLREQYDKTASRMSEMRQEAATAETGLTPLGNAVVPEKPSFPNVPLIVVGSLVLGMGVGVFMSLLVEFFARRVRSPEDLQSLHDLPLLAVIAAPPRAARRGLLKFPSRGRRFVPANA